MRVQKITNSYDINLIKPVQEAPKQNYTPAFQAKFPNGVKKPRHIKEYIAYRFG